MTREMIKGFTMVTLILAIALMTAVVSANAQSATVLVAEVPFEFVVGDQTLPAGEYRIKPSALSSTLAIQSADSGKTAMRLTNGTEPSRRNKIAKLVFHRYGQRYFLAEVWNGNDNAGRQLFKSRQEKAIERELETIAAKSDNPSGSHTTVIVAAVRR